MDMAKYVALFSREARERLGRAEAGLAAGDAAGLAAATGEFHAVKGAAATLGFDAWSAVAEEAEHLGRAAVGWTSEEQQEAARKLLDAARKLLATVDEPQRIRS